MATFETPRPHLIERPLPLLRIAVIAGGESAEREISLQSGAAVARALEERGHRIVTIDPAEVDLASVDWTGCDVAFLALHGCFGEDGHVQQILELANVPYTGSDAAASRLAFSKSAAKERLLQHGVPTPPYVLIHQTDSAEHIRQLARSIGFPLVVKPDTQGSSLGVSIVRDEDELPAAMTNCFQYDTFGLIETYIDGSEWTVGLIDDFALPVIRIRPQRRFFDFEAKYHDDATAYEFEFDEPAPVVRQIERVARQAAQAVGTAGIARVDIRLDRMQHAWVLEINTIPGMTDHSLVPKAAARAGISLGELCERALRSCLRASGALPRLGEQRSAGQNR